MHPADPYFPAPNKLQREFFLYDLWCQVMARAIIAVRRVYDLHDLLALEDPKAAGLTGSLVSFEAVLKGRVYPPAQWASHPIGKTVLTVAQGSTTWTSTLNLKTHYVYSDTGAMSLEGGTENGLALFRSIERIESSGEQRIVTFSCTPLIIGSGVLKIGDMQSDA